MMTGSQGLHDVSASPILSPFYEVWTPVISTLGVVRARSMVLWEGNSSDMASVARTARTALSLKPTAHDESCMARAKEHAQRVRSASAHMGM